MIMTMMIMKMRSMTMANRAQIMRWINRLHVKTTHRRYVDGEVSYAHYKEYVNIVINDK